MTEQTAFPVKYMLISRSILGIPQGYAILDTSFEGKGETVATGKDLEKMDNICKLLNEDEGYKYITLKERHERIVEFQSKGRPSP